MTARLVSGAVMLFVAGCSESTQSSVAYVVPSHDIATSNLEATFAISGEGGDVVAHAGFANATTSDLVNLDGGDQVFCDGVRLAQSGTWIAAELPRKAAGQTYRFELRRATESVFVDVAAIDPVKVTAPGATAELSRRKPLTVTWQASAGTEIDAQLFANCAITNARATAEAGSITLPAFTPGGVVGGPQNASNPPCDGIVSLVRTRKAAATTALGRTAVLTEEADRVKVRVVD